MASKTPPKSCFCSCVILALIGLPGSGKTSFVKSLTEYYNLTQTEATKTRVVHVCYDNLVPLKRQAQMAKNEDHHHPDRETWKIVRKDIVKSVEMLLENNLKSPEKEEGANVNECQMERESSPEIHNFFSILNEKLEVAAQDKKEFLLLVIDDNNYYRSMRYEYYQLARQFEIGILPAPLGHVRRTSQSCQQGSAGGTRETARDRH